MVHQSITETYDRYGNRNAQTAPVAFSQTASATTNRLPSPYAYDASGNMTYDGNSTLTYDGEGRAVSATNGGASGAYVYDGNGLRVKRCVPNCTSPTTSTVYVFSGSKVIAEYDNGAAPSSPSREYIYSGSQLLATISGGVTTYQHPDHLSVRVSTDSSGNVTRSFGHFPFGEVWYESGTASKWKFTSYERDSESGNDYAVARFYSNPMGRFTSADPLPGSVANPQSLNRYAYTGNDPANAVDPLGLTTCDANGNNCYDSVTVTPGGGSGVPGVGLGGDGGAPHYGLLQDTPDPHGGGNSSGKAGDVINAALKEKNLSKCLHKFFGPGTILTNANLPRIDASQDLPGVGQTDARQVPDTGRATIQIDRGTFSSLAANDPFLVGTYLHETANALAIQRFTNIQPRSARARRGPLGGPPSPAQAGAFDKDIGNQFEDCIRN